MSAPPGVVFAFRVLPNAPRCALERDGDRWRLRVDAPPIDGEANARAIAWLAREVFGVPRSQLTLVRGERSRDKAVRVPLTAEELARALAPWTAAHTPA
jgi:hypothetical protein